MGQAKTLACPAGGWGWGKDHEITSFIAEEKEEI